jgi:hypothetical protein
MGSQMSERTGKHPASLDAVRTIPGKPEPLTEAGESMRRRRSLSADSILRSPSRRNGLFLRGRRDALKLLGRPDDAQTAAWHLVAERAPESEAPRLADTRLPALGLREE